jgi:hypothetical protein
VYSIDSRSADDDVANQDICCRSAGLGIWLANPTDMKMSIYKRPLTKSRLAGAGFGTIAAAATELLSTGSMRRYSMLTPVKLLNPTSCKHIVNKTNYKGSHITNLQKISLY